MKTIITILFVLGCLVSYSQNRVTHEPDSYNTISVPDTTIAYFTIQKLEMEKKEQSVRYHKNRMSMKQRVKELEFSVEWFIGTTGSVVISYGMFKFQNR